MFRPSPYDPEALSQQMGALSVDRSDRIALDTLPDPWRWCMLYNVSSIYRLPTASQIYFNTHSDNRRLKIPTQGFATS
jgi:hypothetical protein